MVFLIWSHPQKNKQNYCPFLNFSLKLKNSSLVHFFEDWAKLKTIFKIQPLSNGTRLKLQFLTKNQIVMNDRAFSCQQASKVGCLGSQASVQTKFSVQVYTCTRQVKTIQFEATNSCDCMKNIHNLHQFSYQEKLKEFLLKFWGEYFPIAFPLTQVLNSALRKRTQ